MNVTSHDDQSFINRLSAIIKANLNNEKFGVNELAREAGLSRSMLHRRLIKSIGKSASDLITEKRLEHAKELLEKSDYTSAEIAYKSGFNSPSYFNKVFKKYYQITPNDFKKGEKVVTTSKPEEKPAKNRIGIPVILVSVVFFVALIAWAGFHFWNEKADTTEKSIAILPFDNLSSNNDNQFFADGIVEDLLTRLSSIEDLKVISRTSSEMFRNKGNKTVPEIAELLDVGYILEGSVQRETDDMRISIQLIDAKNDDHILSKQYDRKLIELFEVQREIADEIANELSPILTSSEEKVLKRSQTANLNAFEYKQLGRFYLNKRTQDGFLNSIKYFRLAINEDPDYALAYAEMADAYFLMAWHGYYDIKTGRDSAINLSLKALELDNTVGEAHAVLGVVYNDFDRQYKSAKKEYFKALELNPNHSTTYQYYSEFLATEGKLHEAREILNTAIRLDPFSYIIRYISSLLYCNAGDFEQALIEIKLCQDLVKDDIKAVSQELKIHLFLKDETSAYNCFVRLGQITGHWTRADADSIYNTKEIGELIKWGINKDEWYTELGKALLYSLVGEDDQALKILEKLLDENKLFPFHTGYADFKPLRSNLRFIAIREKMGLPPLQP